MIADIYSETIPAGKLTFTLDGVVFEAPPSFGLVTDKWILNVALIMVMSKEAERLGEMAFRYRDTYGLREEAVFEAIERVRGSDGYKKELTDIISERAMEIREWLKGQYARMGG